MSRLSRVIRIFIIGMLWGFSFQFIVAVTMYNLIFFSAEMLSFYVLFFSPAFLLAIREKAKQGVKLLEAPEKPAES